MYLTEKCKVWILFSYVSIQSLISEGIDVKEIDASGIAVFPYTISTEHSLNASKPETSAQKKQLNPRIVVQLWMISGVEKKAF